MADIFPKNRDELALLIASGFGLGKAPVAPGTAGSLGAVVLYMLLRFEPLTWLLIALVTYMVGVWSATIVEKSLGKDPGIVVIDEFVGQWLALIYLPADFLSVFLGFVAFRAFDITKPPPARQMEQFPGGTGIMLDDVIAGLYANISVQIILSFWS
jgi:phosphatidylglycerophosphatase A